jgi:hypothetical protein
MSVHDNVCRLLELWRSWSCRIRKFGRLPCILVRRTGAVFLPRVCYVMLLGSRVFLCSGQLRDRPSKLKDTAESECNSTPVAVEGVKQVRSVWVEICHFPSCSRLRAIVY